MDFCNLGQLGSQSVVIFTVNQLHGREARYIASEVSKDIIAPRCRHVVQRILAEYYHG
jgi:hypothetical protein